MGWLIYKITNILNSKIYIGITKRSLNKRLNEHKSCKKSAISKAINKYGIDNFLMEQIDDAETLSEALSKETFYINQFDSFIRANGYNIEINSISGETTLEAKVNLVSSLKLKKEQNLKNPYVGVFYSCGKNSWVFSFAFNGQKICKAKFSSAKDAALARDIKICSLFEEKTCQKLMNFPDLYQRILNNNMNEPERNLKISSKKSNFKHVSYEKRSNQWRVRFSKNLAPKIKINFGGLFANEIDAAKTADYCLISSGFGSEILNFPENFETYSNCSFKTPQPTSFLKKKIKYKNISFENGIYRIYIEYNKQTFRPSFKTLEEAISARNEKLKSLGKLIPSD